MLESAYLHTTEGEINKLISEGDYKYLSFSNYRKYEHVELTEDEWDKIQRISVDNYGNILGYFSASINQAQHNNNLLFFQQPILQKILQNPALNRNNYPIFACL